MFNGNRPNVVLVVLDCLRRDYWRRSMPLSKKATEGWFHLDNHYAVAHCSDPNHWALFRGLGGPWNPPYVTSQMGKAFQAVSPALMPNQLKWAGYFTTAVQPVIVPKFYHLFDVIAWHKGYQNSDPELRAVRQFASEREGRPWFLFVRSMSCHYPYNEIDDMPARGEAAEIRPQYEAAVEHEDRFVHNLIEYLLNEHPNTIIAICSDHGEGLGEGGLYDHLFTLRSVLTQVPFALYVPGLAGRRTRAATQHVDFWPTVAELLGIRVQAEGYSWARWLRAEADAPAPDNRKLWLSGTGAGPLDEQLRRAEEAGEHMGWRIDPQGDRVLWRHRSVAWGKWKLTHNVYAGGQGGDAVAGWELTKTGDYLERKDYAGEERRIVERLKAHLPPLPDYHPWEEAAVGAWLANGELEPAEDEAILGRLKALGYA